MSMIADWLRARRERRAAAQAEAAARGGRLIRRLMANSDPDDPGHRLIADLLARGDEAAGHRVGDTDRLDRP
jgi:hypothetical protein